MHLPLVAFSRQGGEGGGDIFFREMMLVFRPREGQLAIVLIERDRQLAASATGRDGGRPAGGRALGARIG
eukprot:5104321-Pyramimonas_sp.AAC.1